MKFTFGNDMNYLLSVLHAKGGRKNIGLKSIFSFKIEVWKLNSIAD